MNADTSSSSVPEDDTDLSRTYVLVLVVEVIVILGLYWLSRAFS